MSWFRHNEEDALREAAYHRDEADTHTSEAATQEAAADRFHEADDYLDGRWTRGPGFTGDPSHWFGR